MPANVGRSAHARAPQARTRPRTMAMIGNVSDDASEDARVHIEVKERP